MPINCYTNYLLICKKIQLIIGETILTFEGIKEVLTCLLQFVSCQYLLEMYFSWR
jgi:hypothetical protein